LCQLFIFAAEKEKCADDDFQCSNGQCINKQFEGKMIAETAAMRLAAKSLNHKKQTPG
jgi:hypothetical protein